MSIDWFTEIAAGVEGLSEELDSDKLKSAISDIIQKTLDETSELKFQSLKSETKGILEEDNVHEQVFLERINQVWKKPLELLELLIIISSKSGEMSNEEYGKQAEIERSYSLEVLLRLQTRACQVSREILCLLKGGFADGAMARWRTLHELSVLGYFIIKHGEDIAKKYMEYEHIERFKEMKEYQQWVDKLGYERLTEKEMKLITDRKNELITKYGAAYYKDYGWAADVLGKQVNFKAIEEDTGMGHLRPFYKMANNYVHSGSKASTYSLGTMPNEKIFLGGASDYGLAEPGQNASISLMKITTLLINSVFSYHKLVISDALLKLSKEICKCFVETQNEFYS